MWDENHEDHSQVDQTRFPDVCGDEFGCHLDGGEEEGEVASRGGAEAELVSEDMAIVRRTRYARYDEISCARRGSTRAGRGRTE